MGYRESRYEELIRESKETDYKCPICGHYPLMKLSDAEIKRRSCGSFFWIGRYAHAHIHLYFCPECGAQF